MSKFVFLDLEGTVVSLIEDQMYSTTELINTTKVRHWLKEQDASAIGIFSFAIDNDAERTTFLNSWLRRDLEERLDVTIGRVVTVEEVRTAILLRYHVKLENLWEVKQKWGKERGFVDFSKVTFKNCEVVLLDDLVDNTSLSVFDRKLTVTTVNVNDLR